METDEQLFRRVREGDMDAFEALYERYEAPLFGFLLSRLESRADAEDVLHEAFLRALRGAEPALAPGGFRAWVFRVAHNLASNARRSGRRAERALSRADGGEAPARADAELEASERDGALLRAVARLPEPLSTLFHLRASGLSYEEMASVLEVPLGTLKSRMNRMLELLRDEMKPWTAPLSPTTSSPTRWTCCRRSGAPPSRST